MPAVRALVQLVIGAGVLLGMVAAILRRRKALPATGLALCLGASLLGGAGVPIDGPVESRVSLGLDWFLLNLLVLALVFVPLERVRPQRPEQGVFRPGWTTDTLHFFVSHLLVQATTFLAVMPAAAVAAATGALVGSAASWSSASRGPPSTRISSSCRSTPC